MSELTKGDGEMSAASTEIRDAADEERKTLIAQAMAGHLNNIEVEGRRFAEEVRQIEGIYLLRIGRA